MSKTYFYLTGILDSSGKPMICTFNQPVTNENWILIQVVDDYGQYSEKELLQYAKEIERKDALAKIAELTELYGEDNE